MKHTDILSKMTLEQKASLCSGKDFWHLHHYDELGLPEIMVSDGPHGLRKQNKDKKKGDIMGSVPAVCFPTASLTACSWDEELLYEMGQALGDECRAEQVSVLLGPGMNIKRSPVCGRNFEYFSEDPFLAGKMAASFIKGVQSKGVGTSLKHFAANSQETRRMTVDSVADERTLREIYLAGFEIAVKEGKPWTVMNAYNKLNGTYCAENEWLLGQVLRKEWGFDGVVVTDWGAENDIVQGIKAGQSLEMPGSNGLGAKKLIQAVKNGTLTEGELDARVDEILDVILKAKNTLGSYHYSAPLHHALARKIAEQAMVLLKNEDGILPLHKGEKIALIGEMAKAPRYQGAGSSQIVPTALDCAYDAFVAGGTPIVYAKGYHKKSEVTDITLLAEAVNAAKCCKTAVLFIGLTEEYESEGFDREHMRLPKNHIALANAVIKANPNTVIVLSGGSPVELHEISGAKAILNAYLAGQASGSAVYNVLTGKENPCGKLAETYPVHFEDNPSYNNFPGSPKSVEFREGLYIGYRYYDKAGVKTEFPFGYGLSYTTFAYSDCKLSKKTVKDTDTLTVTVTVKNTGSVAGAEIVQLYINDVNSTVYRPEKELKAFAKVFLQPGEEKEVTLTLDKRSFAFYNVAVHDWTVETGDFNLLIGSSSQDIKLTAKVRVNSTADKSAFENLPTVPDCYFTGDVHNVSDADYQKLLGKTLPYTNDATSDEVTMNSSLEAAAGTAAGEKINNLLLSVFRIISKGNAAQEKMMTSMALQIPIRCFVSMSMGVFTEEMAQGLCDILNGKGTLKGIGKIVGGLVGAVKNIGTLLSSI